MKIFSFAIFNYLLGTVIGIGGLLYALISKNWDYAVLLVPGMMLWGFTFFFFSLDKKEI